MGRRVTAKILRLTRRKRTGSLVLDRPVNVRGNSGPKSDYDTWSVEHIRKIQLVLKGEHDELIGKKVLVKGTLFHGFTGHHHTDVLMDVQSIGLEK